MYLTADGTYKADITDIAAKDMQSTICVSVVYIEDGTEYCTGVNAYNLAQYLKANANNSDEELSALAQASVVYGYYAKNLFTEI